MSERFTVPNIYTKNPNWVSEDRATRLHRPCGYWYRGSQLSIVKTPIYKDVVHSEWTAPEGWISKGITPSTSCGCLWSMTNYQNELYARNPGNHLYRWDFTEDDWEAIVTELHPLYYYAVSPVIVANNRVYWLVMEQQIVGLGTVRCILKALSWGPGESSMRVEAEDNIYYTTYLDFDLAYFEDYLVAAITGLYDVLTTDGYYYLERYTDWDTYTSLPREDYAVLFATFGSELFMEMNGVLYYSKDYKQSFPGTATMAATKSPFQKTQTNSLFEHEGILVKLINDGTGFDNRPVYFWNGIKGSEWIRNSFIHVGCLKYPTLYGGLWFVVDTTNSKLYYFNATFTGLTQVNDDAINAQIISLIVCNDHLCALAKTGSSETTFLTLDGGFTTWTEQIIIGYTETYEWEPLKVDDAVWPMR